MDNLQRDFIFKKIMHGGGVSLDKTGAQVNISPIKDTYIVSVKAYDIIKASDFRAYHIDGYLSRFNLAPKSNKSILGFWLDKSTDLLYIDLSYIVRDKIKAVKLALLNKQLAIYDVKNDCSITIDTMTAGEFLHFLNNDNFGDGIILEIEKESYSAIDSVYIDCQSVEQDGDYTIDELLDSIIKDVSMEDGYFLESINDYKAKLVISVY